MNLSSDYTETPFHHSREMTTNSNINKTFVTNMTYPYTQQYFQFHTSIICMHSDLLNCISVCDMNFKLWIRELIFLGMSVAINSY